MEGESNLLGQKWFRSEGGAVRSALPARPEQQPFRACLSHSSQGGSESDGKALAKSACERLKEAGKEKMGQGEMLEKLWSERRSP